MLDKLFIESVVLQSDGFTKVTYVSPLVAGGQICLAILVVVLLIRFYVTAQPKKAQEEKKARNLLAFDIW